ncbi:hypothetical protein FA15DRAFT_699637 [Coprinopsis marcescibilis]|uniref:Uncharacterized protein n=1 Tax=Coprinopsis marcescibilis TaxID=230819 RepID=A0A5C3LBV6_COPMA|nr:hypothetical protein FA15DRAFT_699637 [Coprinopsis marcescibilis]
MASSPAPTCTAQDTIDWSFNSLGQSPCEVASILAGVCVSEGFRFRLPPLTNPRQFYTGPKVDEQNSCRCSSVVYSLMSACSRCQGGSILQWLPYSANCSTKFHGSYPMPIPEGVAVPRWAYMDVEVERNIFQSSAAVAIAGEVTSADNAPPTIPIPEAPSAQEPQKTSNVGAITGGVVGGVVFLALIGILAGFFLRRRKQTVEAEKPPDLDKADSYGVDALALGDESFNTHQFTGTTLSAPAPPLKLYDPDDPSTFPSAKGDFESRFPNKSFGSPDRSSVATSDNYRLDPIHPNFTGMTGTTAMTNSGMYTGHGPVI